MCVVSLCFAVLYGQNQAYSHALFNVLDATSDPGFG